MVKRIVLVFLLKFLLSEAYATHIVGGEISLKWLSGNDFELTLNFFRDCSPGTADFDPVLQLGVYDKVTHALSSLIAVPLISSDTVKLGDSCYIPPGLCVERGFFQSTITLPDNINGYYITWQRCCRNHIINNIIDPGTAAMVFYIETPDPAIHNSSPYFGNYPNSYMCVDRINQRDFSAIDPDGDSLVYSLVTPLNGNANPGQVTTISPAPYPEIIWQTPYDLSNIMGGSPPLTINPRTGMLTGFPITMGVYVFAVRVEEFRNGIKIGEIRRDVQFSVIACTTNEPPVFVLPGFNKFSLIATESGCFPIRAEDPNSTDWVSLRAVSELLTGSLGQSVTFTSDSALATVQSEFCVNARCDMIRKDPYRITFYARDYNCYGTNVIPFDVDIYVLSPFDGKIDSVIPNVFTPNGDNINDVFRVNAEQSKCFNSFSIQVFNRWGKTIFESEDFMFSWDGKFKGSDVPEGIYYYILNTEFLNSSFRTRGILHLLR